MGFDPLTLALTAGGLSALSSLQQTSAANKQARYQQDVAEANAAAARNQAKITAEKGFSQDVALNRYQKALSEWETGENVKALEANAANYDAAASYYGSTVKGLGNSLLTAGITGLTSGIGVYSMAGGFGGANQWAGNTFAKSGANKVMHANQYVKLGH